jgi:type I restriction enzyme S subunit
MTNPNLTWRPLGELFEIGAGKTMSSAARAGADKVPFLRTSNVLWDAIDLAEVHEMSIPPGELAGKSLRAGDLLVCEGGEIGRAAVWDGRVLVMAFQNHLHRLRPIRGDVEARFYVYFLQSAFTQLGIFEGAGNKTTIPNLSRSRLASLEVPHPPLAEQQGIARTLAKIREAIAVHDEAAATAQELKRAAMRELFTRGLRGEPQKETEIGPVPESWEIVPLGSIALARGGTSFPPLLQGRSRGDLPFYKVSDMNLPGNEVEMLTSVNWINRTDAEQLRAKPFPRETIIFPKVGGALHTNKKRILSVESLVDNNIMGVTVLDPEFCLPKYLFGWFQTLNLSAMANSGPLPSINGSQIYELKLPIPRPDEQRDIVTILDAIDRKIDLHRKKRAALEELFKALLHKLMTGEIRVADLDLAALDRAGTAAAMAGEEVV